MFHLFKKGDYKMFKPKYCIVLTVPANSKNVMKVLQQFYIDTDDLSSGEILELDANMRKKEDVDDIVLRLKEAGAINVNATCVKTWLATLLENARALIRQPSEKATLNTATSRCKPWRKRKIRDLNLFAEISLEKAEELLKKIAIFVKKNHQQEPTETGTKDAAKVKFSWPVVIGTSAGIIFIILFVYMWLIKPNTNGVIAETGHPQSMMATKVPVIRTQPIQNSPSKIKPVKTDDPSEKIEQKEKSTLATDKRPESVPVQTLEVQNTPPDTKPVEADPFDVYRDPRR
jgi:hypothetical protein